MTAEQNTDRLAERSLTQLLVFISVSKDFIKATFRKLFIVAKNTSYLLKDFSTHTLSVLVFSFIKVK